MITFVAFVVLSVATSLYAHAVASLLLNIREQDIIIQGIWWTYWSTESTVVQATRGLHVSSMLVPQ